MTACLGCGSPLSSPNPRARYCNSTCRAAAFKRRRNEGTTTVLALAPSGDDEPTPPSVLVEVRAHLEAAGRVNTPLGAAALTIAARMDRGIDTASALASAAKQLDATLTAATAGAETKLSPLERMRRDRDAKRHA